MPRRHSLRRRAEDGCLLTACKYIGLNGFGYCYIINTQDGICICIKSSAVPSNYYVMQEAYYEFFF